MSQAVSPESVEQYSSPVAADVKAEFDYKPVPVLAPVTLFLGLASGLALWAEIGVAVCVVGIAVGLLSRWKIRKTPDEVGGGLLTAIGLIASVCFFFAGIATHVHAYATEVPDGHFRVNFSRDISAKEFIYENGIRKIHPDVIPYDNQKIYIKGYMWKTQKNKGLEKFMFLKDNGKCCFDGKAKPYHMMHVILQDGKTVDKIEGLVAVAGVLRCNPMPRSEGEAVYIIEAILVEPARTAH